MTEEKPKPPKISQESAQEAGEAAYSRAILQHSLGKKAESLAALEEALSLGFPPAILTQGSVEYQRQQQEQGKQLLFSLLALPKTTENLFQIIDEAGSFLISVNEFDDASELYRKAAKKFPEVAEFHQRVAYCASQEGNYDEALAASRLAVELDPNNASYLSDMGWTLILAERYQEAEAALLQALEIDPSNQNAEENLQYCRERLSEQPSTPPETELPPAPSAKKARKKRSPKRG